MVEFIFLLILVIVWGMLYVPLNSISALRHADYGTYFITHLDTIIPYSTKLFFVYVLLYCLPLLVVMIFFKTKYNIIIARKICAAYIMTYLIGYIIYLAFPNSTYLLIKDMFPTMCSKTKGLIYYFNSHITTDYGANPSLHIATAWLYIKSWFEYYPKSLFKKYTSTFLTAWFILLLISIVTLKYHYIFDALCGFFLGEIMYSLIVRNDLLKTIKWDVVISIKKLL